MREIEVRILKTFISLEVYLTPLFPLENFSDGKNEFCNLKVK